MKWFPPFSTCECETVGFVIKNVHFPPREFIAYSYTVEIWTKFGFVQETKFQS